MLDQSYYEKADAIIEQYGRKPASLIPLFARRAVKVCGR